MRIYVFLLKWLFTMKQLQQFDTIPYNHSALVNILNRYKAPNDKISRLIDSGSIIKLKKGLYVNSESYRTGGLSKELIANSIYGPSYISLDTALSFYGIIPEKVYVTNSITTKRSRDFNTPIGLFRYFQTKATYYSIGISQAASDRGYNFLIASPEKALCDKIVFTKNLSINSVKAMHEFIIYDIRANIEALQNLNFTHFVKCIEVGKKHKQLELLLKAIKNI